LPETEPGPDGVDRCLALRTEIVESSFPCQGPSGAETGSDRCLALSGRG
jgi:hypothetical protein